MANTGEEEADGKLSQILRKGSKTRNKKDGPEGDVASPDFEEILELVGSQGLFQKRLLYGILCPISILSPFLAYGSVFLWDIPQHWCHLPNGETGNGSGMGFEEWGNYSVSFSEDGIPNECEMLEFNEKSFENKTTSCQFGWDYDKTDYSSTIPSQYDWVCEREHYATDCFTYYGFGAAVGTAVFGTFADKYGRKLTFFLGCLLDLLFNISSLFLAHEFTVYKILMILRGFATGAQINVYYLLSAEVSGTEYRAWIYAITWMVWVGGNCLLPFVAMICRDWFIFGWVCAIPGIIVFGFYPFVYESPRWLVSKGEEEKAVKILVEIAKQNGKNEEGLIETKRKVERMVMQLGIKLKNEKETNRKKNSKKDGIWTLFTNRRLASNFWMLAIALSMNYLLYDVLTLNSTKMAGNRFLNYFYLGLIELPGGWVGGKLVDLTGRRWTQVGFFFVCALFCLLCSVFVVYPDWDWVVVLGAVGVKFAVTVTGLVGSIQATEIFPTPLRSTGTGLATTVASVAGVLGPYMVYTGTFHPSLPYGILFICSMLGVVAASFLPETFQQNLLETVEEADEFSKQHPFWSYLPNYRSKKEGNVHCDNLRESKL